MDTKTPKIEPYTPDWHAKAYELLRAWHSVIACGRCGYPTLKGYCCTTCGDMNPSNPNPEN